MLVVLSSTFWAAPAEAAPAGPVAITCGAILRQDAYLPADLTCPTGNGVTAAASLSIDLQGHHLTGSSSGVGITVQYPAGVKVTHGRLTGWGKGLTTVSTRSSPPAVPAKVTVIAVTFLHNGTGIAPGEVSAAGGGEYTPSYTVYRSWFVSNQIGIGGDVSDVDVKVSGATFRNNRVAVSFDGDIFTIIGGVTVSDSDISNNGVGVFCTHSACTLQRNGFSANPTAVSTADYFTYLEMTGNTITGSTTAVDLHDNLVSQLVGNTFTGNKTAVSYDVGGGSVSDNIFSGNGTALTMVDAGGGEQYPPIPVTGNRVSTNTGDGIVISGGEVQLKNNISTFNHGWGIKAPGAVDQGGNRAFGNYHSPQCVGVVCTH